MITYTLQQNNGAFSLEVADGDGILIIYNEISLSDAFNAIEAIDYQYSANMDELTDE